MVLRAEAAQAVRPGVKGADQSVGHRGKVEIVGRRLPTAGRRPDTERVEIRCFMERRLLFPLRGHRSPDCSFTMPHRVGKRPAMSDSKIVGKAEEQVPVRPRTIRFGLSDRGNRPERRGNYNGAIAKARLAGSAMISSRTVRAVRNRSGRLDDLNREKARER